jgi:hypothetical protein
MAVNSIDRASNIDFTLNFYFFEIVDVLMVMYLWILHSPYTNVNLKSKSLIRFLVNAKSLFGHRYFITFHQS